MSKPLLLLLIALIQPLAAARADELPPEFFAAESAFRRARNGDAAAVESALAGFSRLAASDSPQAPLYLAYLGAAYTFKGRDAWMPWTKLRATERGLDLVEKAMRRLEPSHERLIARGNPLAVETRLVAASSLLAVPGFFNRFASGRQAVAAALASPAFDAATAEVKARVHQLAARVAAQDGDRKRERFSLEAVVGAAPDSPLAADARRRLAEMGS